MRLETDRFFLQSLTEADITEKYLAWMKDETVIATLDPKREQTQDSLKAYLHSHDGVKDFLLGIFTKEGEHIGNISFRSNPMHKVATAGIMIGEKAFWGKGVVLEARKALLNWAFDIFGIEKIEAGCHSTNLPAVFNFKKQKWVLEGIRKRHFIISDKPIDVLLYAMFKKDWNEFRNSTGS